MSAENIYRGANGEDYHQAVHDLPALSIPWVTKLRSEKLSRHLSVSEEVFEYGAGLGFNIRGLNARVKVAYDIASHLSDQYTSTDIDFVSELSSVEGRRFSTVICHHVLEHVPSPLETLKEIDALLADKGKLLLYVPLEQKARHNKVNSSDKDNHIYSWCGQSIHNLLTVAGYDVETLQIKRFGYDFFSARLAHKLKLGEFGYKLLKLGLHFLRPVHEIEVVARRRAA